MTEVWIVNMLNQMIYLNRDKFFRIEKIEGGVYDER